jgi:regulator of protease activity HflC (stomatin/prohibitin superfamily)
MFTRGKTAVKGPGLHWYLPFWSDPMIYPVKRQTLNLPPQVLTTKDLKEILTSVVVTYEIDDIHKALVDTYDFEDTIRETAQGAVKKVISVKEFNEILENQHEIDVELCRRIRSVIRPFGVRVVEAVITDFGKTKIYRLVGDACEARSFVD